MSERNNMLRSVVAHAATPAVALMAEFKQLAHEHRIASERHDAVQSGQCDHDVVRAEWIAAADRYEAFRLRLVHMRTRDPDIISLKAAVVAEMYTYEDDGIVRLDGAIERCLKEPGNDDEALCFSIVRDLALRFGSVA